MTASGVSRRAAVFLDRDGVLNDVTVRDGIPRPPASPDELRLRAGASAACRRLHEAGLLLLVVSNQPDIARGTVSREVVEAINGRLREALPLDDVLFCPHDDGDDCECRKPRPGLLRAASERWNVDLARSVMVGDRWRDVEAGRRAGCGTVFVDAAYGEPAAGSADLVVASLEDGVEWILHHSGLPAMEESRVTETRALRVKIFADGADRERMVELAGNELIQGFTTNPTLMRAAGVEDYEAFARGVLEALPSLPISFEVFADDVDEMERQARKIATWGDNVYTKIPVTDTRGESTAELVQRLSGGGIKLNVTALLTTEQVRTVTEALAGGAPSFVSVFAGRIADTGRDPVPLMCEALEILRPHPDIELIWASPREVLNLVQANAIGCDVITVTPDLLKKVPILGRDLADLSLDTVRMFHRDAVAAGYVL